MESTRGQHGAHLCSHLAFFNHSTQLGGQTLVAKCVLTHQGHPGYHRLSLPQKSPLYPLLMGLAVTCKGTDAQQRQHIPCHLSIVLVTDCHC